MADICPICEGSGLLVVEREGGLRVAQPCECRAARRAVRIIEQARIPAKYALCDLDSFHTDPEIPGTHNVSLAAAVTRARGFVRNYPVNTEGKGLLLSGPHGVGKTHLAVGILQALMRERGASGLFVTYGDLLRQIQNTYNNSVQETELDILRPVVEAEVLVLDELGSLRLSEWVQDTLAHILNTRYNELRTTIITTNYANKKVLTEDDIPPLDPPGRAAWLSVQKDGLAERIGERMRSRLQEMCLVVEMTGVDLRQKVKRASFA